MSEEALAKSGPELFREVLRLYETAEFEDYYKGGVWKDDLMRTDLVLLDAHRKEGGAPDPPELEDVKLPTLRVMGQLPSVGDYSAPVGLQPLTVTLSQPTGPTTASLIQGAVASGAVTSSAGPVAELRLIALFVAKWKLEPTKTKMTLAKLTPQRRRYVMQFFKASAQGEAASAELESFIADCETSGEWDKGAPGGGAIGSPASKLLGGIKRPLSLVQPVGAADAAKRPRPLGASPVLVNGVPAKLAAAGVQTPQGSLAARLAAARAQAAQRPVSPRPLGLIAGQRPIIPIRPGGLVRPTLTGQVRPGSLFIKR
jgi:hypothetical protein